MLSWYNYFYYYFSISCSGRYWTSCTVSVPMQMSIYRIFAVCMYPASASIGIAVTVGCIDAYNLWEQVYYESDSVHMQCHEIQYP